jgi:hypothetical protein
MRTQAQAVADGCTIDNHAPGRPLAYREADGFRVVHAEWVLTELEEELLAALRQAKEDMLPNMSHGEVLTLEAVIDAVIAKATK